MAVLRLEPARPAGRLRRSDGWRRQAHGEAGAPHHGARRPRDLRLAVRDEYRLRQPDRRGESLDDAVPAEEWVGGPSAHHGLAGDREYVAVPGWAVDLLLLGRQRPVGDLPAQDLEPALEH